MSVKLTWGDYFKLSSEAYSLKKEFVNFINNPPKPTNPKEKLTTFFYKQQKSFIDLTDKMWECPVFLFDKKIGDIASKTLRFVHQKYKLALAAENFKKRNIKNYQPALVEDFDAKELKSMSIVSVNDTCLATLGAPLGIPHGLAPFMEPHIHVHPQVEEDIKEGLEHAEELPEEHQTDENVRKYFVLPPECRAPDNQSILAENSSDIDWDGGLSSFSSCWAGCDVDTSMEGYC